MREGPVVLIERQRAMPVGVFSCVIPAMSRQTVDDDRLNRVTVHKADHDTDHSKWGLSSTVLGGSPAVCDRQANDR